MSNDLIKFWQQCNLNVPPFTHPEDLPLMRTSKRWTDDHAANFDDYIAGPRFADPDDKGLHLGLRPLPYVGNLRRAKIVILLLNPGFGHSDYWAESHGPGFRERIMENFRQTIKGNDFPFIFLDPKFCWNGGFIWWEKKLRKVVQKIAAQKFAGNYRDGLRSLSSKLACVELFPYHSSSFGEHKLIKHLRSVEVARHFVRDELIPDARAGKRTVIATRQAKAWDVKKGGTRNLIVYKGGHTRGASLGPNSPGGKAILKHYGIS